MPKIASSAESKAASAIRVGIVAGEASGDALAAGLIARLKADAPGSTFIGVGGKKMAAAGCRLLYPMGDIGVMGFDGLLRQLPKILRIRRNLVARFSRERPDVFIGVDVPDFNLGLARKLKAQNIPCVHYVSPTVWAWRGYRIHKIRHSIHHILTLFPFEADYYRAHAIPVTYVGHPIADAITAPDRARARKQLGLGDARIIALLPGSRRSEIRRLGQVFIDAAHAIHAQFPAAEFVLPFAGPAVAAEFQRSVKRHQHLPLRTLDGDARRVLEACDIALVASGTAALEAALLERAHVVAYKIPALSYHLVRRLTHVQHYSMPNHLLPEPMVAEFIQNNATAANIAAEAIALLGAPERVATLQQHFAKMRQDLRRNANRCASQAVLKLVRERPD